MFRKISSSGTVMAKSSSCLPPPLLGREAEHGVLHPLDLLEAHRRGARPAAEGFGVAVGVQGDGIPVGLVVHQDLDVRVPRVDDRTGEGSVHHLQLDEGLAFQDERNVRRLAAFTIENEVLGTAEGILDGEDLVVHGADLHGLLGRGHARPGAAKVIACDILVSPHIEVDSLPAGEILDIDGHGILGLLHRRFRGVTAVRRQRDRVAGVHDDDDGGLRVQEEVVGAVFEALDVGAVLLHREGFAEGGEVAAEVDGPVGVLAELELVAGADREAQARVPGAVGHHRLVRIPAVARGGDGADDAPRAGLGHLGARVGGTALGGIRSLGHAVGRHVEEVILHAVLVAILEVVIGLSGDGDRAADGHARPAAAQVVHVAPLIQGEAGAPARLVDDIHADAVMLGQRRTRRIHRRLEVLGPLVGIDIGPFARADGQLVGDVLVLGTPLEALLDIVEGEAVGEGLAALEGRPWKAEGST